MVDVDINSTDMAVISSEQVRGTSVFDKEGARLGSIETLMIDKASGLVKFAVLESGGFLGIATDRYPLPWDMLCFDLEQDGYVVPFTKDGLKDAPRYGEEEKTPYTDEYRQQISDYYDIKV